MAVEMRHRDDLGTLSNPDEHHAPASLAGISRDRAHSMLRSMVLIRLCEERIADGVASGEIRCPCHLAIGQEAVAVGIAEHIRASDKCFGAHRSHAHYLALGGSVDRMMAEIHGKDTGCSRGMGGSMHLRDERIGLVGTVPIVGATIPMAVGAGLALKMDGGDGVAVAFFGDGATEEGAFHESMNLAASLPSPTVFVCEHNLFSSHLHISLRQPSSRVARYAEAHCVPHQTVDGNDLGAVLRASAEAVEHSRTSRHPYFLEFVTYRWRGHVGHREDIDVGVHRKDDLHLWKRRDPIRRCADALVAEQGLGPNELEAITADARAQVESAWEFAIRSPYPARSELIGRVFAGGGAT
jgi:TPP-dependent pyruvate/acetoin dehydrogenase alpha subunit